MKKKLMERREELLRAAVKRVPIKTVAEEMSKAETEDPAERTRIQLAIQKDWSRRSVWMPNLVKINDPTILAETVAGLREILPCAWGEYASGDSSSSKIAALRLAKETYHDIIDLLQSVGAVQKIPTEIAGTVAMVGVGMPFEADPTIIALSKKLLAEDKKGE